MIIIWLSLNLNLESKIFDFRVNIPIGSYYYFSLGILMPMKTSQVILAFDGAENNINLYEGILHGKRYLIKQAFTKKELFEKYDEYIPDIIIINTKTVKEDSIAIAKEFLGLNPKTPLLILGLDPKKQDLKNSIEGYGPYYDEYPLNSGSFHSVVSKATKNIKPLVSKIEGKEVLEVVSNAHFLMLNEAEFVFGSSVKYFSGDVIELESDFFEHFGQRKVQFTIIKNGEFIAKRQYKNIGVLQGACSKFQQKLKAYYVKNRGNSKK